MSSGILLWYLYHRKKSNNIYLSLTVTASSSQGPAVSTVGRTTASTPTPTGPGLSLHCRSAS